MSLVSKHNAQNIENFLRSLAFPTESEQANAIARCAEEYLTLEMLKGLSDDEFEELNISVACAKIIREEFDKVRVLHLKCSLFEQIELQC